MDRLIHEDNYIFKRKVNLKKYKLSKVKFYNFIQQFYVCIGSKTSIKSSIENEFGHIYVNNIDDFKDIIENSKAIYSIELTLYDNDTRKLILFNYFAYESLRNTTSLTLKADDKQWIINSEKDILDFLKETKSKFAFIHWIFTEFILWFVIFTFLFYWTYIIVLGLKPQEVTILQADLLIVIIIMSIAYLFTKVLQLLIAPTLKIKFKSGIFNRITVAFRALYLTKKQDIIIAIVVGLVFFILGKIT